MRVRFTRSICRASTLPHRSPRLMLLAALAAAATDLGRRSFFPRSSHNHADMKHVRYDTGLRSRGRTAALRRAGAAVLAVLVVIWIGLNAVG